MKRAPFIAGGVVLFGAWVVAAAGTSLTAHMAAHMAAVAVAAPLIAHAVAGGAWDPARHWPDMVAPLPMSLVELFVVWGWHLPAARAFAASSGVGLGAEQAMFFGAGLLLWSACLGSQGGPGDAGRRAAGVVALLLTTMHMTLLGALITLAPRLLFDGHGGHAPAGSAPSMADQQIGGVVMLLVGAGSYLAGGLYLLGRTLRAGGSMGVLR